MNRRAAIIAVAGVCAAVIFYLLLGSIPGEGGGTLGGSGYKVWDFGVLGFITVRTELSWYGAGNVPVSRETQFHLVPLLETLAIVFAVAALGFLFLRRAFRSA